MTRNTKIQKSSQAAAVCGESRMHGDNGGDGKTQVTLGVLSLPTCGVVFSAWIPMPGEPDGALLLGHIRQSPTAELKPFLDQVHTDDDLTPAILQAYEVVDEPRKKMR